MNEQKITGPLFQQMVIEGALAIAEKKEAANELNVFPVPDGDTGTNMYMTMHAAQEEMERLTDPTLEKAVEQTASALLRSARVIFLSISSSACLDCPKSARKSSIFPLSR